MPAADAEKATAVTSSVRVASFLAALALSVALMLFPFLLHQVAGGRLHTALPIVMLGIAGALVHGIGYRPDNRLLRMLFAPSCAWTMIGGGALLLLA